MHTVDEDRAGAGSRQLAHALFVSCCSKMPTSAVSTTDRFYFTKEQLQNTPSRKNGIDPEKEQSYRQQAATLIQDMGQRLSVYPFVKRCHFYPFLHLYVAPHSLAIPCVESFNSLTKCYRSQLTINTAIVYMHRFYMFHSFNKFHRNVS